MSIEVMRSIKKKIEAHYNWKGTRVKDALYFPVHTKEYVEFRIIIRYNLSSFLSDSFHLSTGFRDVITAFEASRMPNNCVENNLFAHIDRMMVTEIVSIQSKDLESAISNFGVWTPARWMLNRIMKTNKESVLHDLIVRYLSLFTTKDEIQQAGENVKLITNRHSHEYIDKFVNHFAAVAELTA